MEPSRSPDQYPELGRRHRTVEGRSVLFDDEGFLWYPEDWTEAENTEDGLVLG